MPYTRYLLHFLQQQTIKAIIIAKPIIDITIAIIITVSPLFSVFSKTRGALQLLSKYK